MYPVAGPYEEVVSSASVVVPIVNVLNPVFVETEIF
jgi:hypothetical protein